MVEKVQKVYKFGAFRLDLPERILLRNGKPIVLTPKVFDLLALLVKNHGHLLTKEELLAELWPDSFVEEANLNVNVSALRRALGESPAESQFIETVPRRGYRFVAEVSEVETDFTRTKETSKPEPTPTTERPDSSLSRNAVAISGKWRNRWVLWAMTIFVLLAGASLLAWRFTHRSSGSGSPIRTVAVLPFKPLAGDSTDAALEIGMADALITRLSNSKQIVVRPTSSVVKYSGLGTDTLSAGRELEVDAVLEGRVQRADNRIRVTVQLLRVNGGVPLWAGTFDDYFTNIFAVQDSISEKMADALSMHLTGHAKQLITKRDTESTEAYQSYMQGRYLHFKYQFENALKFFEAAVEKDPEYPLAYTGLALNYAAMSTTKPERRQEFADKAIAAAKKAVSLDPELDEAHNALGWVQYIVQWDWAGGEEEFQRAIQLNPNNSQAHINYATVLSIQGKYERSLQEGQLALRLDPSSGDVYFNHVFHLYNARRYDEALSVAQKGVETEPDHPYWIWLIPRIYLAQSKFEDAIREQEKRTQGDALRRSMVLGYVYARTGRRREAETILNTLLQSAKPNNTAVAYIYIGLGEKARALDYLEKAYEQRDNIITHLKVEPLFDTLRGEPRFQELQRRVHLE